jgi:hypothetical protein
VGGPDAVIENGAVEASKRCDCRIYERLAVFRSEERLLDCAAEFGAATFCDEGFGLFGGGAVAEGYLCSSLTEEADGGSSDSAGASGDESYFSFEGQDYACGVAIRHILDAIESLFRTQASPVSNFLSGVDWI